MPMTQEIADKAIVQIVRLKLDEQGHKLTDEQVQATINALRWMQAKLKEQKG